MNLPTASQSEKILDQGEKICIVKLSCIPRPAASKEGMSSMKRSMFGSLRMSTRAK